jgi:Tfp pilus assembly protein PilX
VRRNAKEEGFVLIMMIGIMAALAIMAATVVMVTANTQAATADGRSQVSSFDYAEAGLESAVTALRTLPWPAAGQSFTTSSLTAAYDATYPSGPPLKVLVYDNQPTVDPTVTWDKGGSTNAGVPDGKLWAEAQVTVSGKTSRVRELVGQVNLTSKLSLPAAVLYTDCNIVDGTGGSGNAYAVTSSGTPDTSKTAAVYAGGTFTGNWSSNLQPPGGASGATLAVDTNGTVYNPAVYGNTNTHPGTGGVAPLASVLPQSTLATMTAQARAGTPTQADANGTVVTSALLNQLQATSPQTYNATTDLVVNGNLMLGGGPSTFNFKSLYVTGNLTLGGNTSTNTTSLYVGGSFTISGPSGTSSFGPTYVGGSVNWGGALSVHASPLYVAGNFVTQGGPFSHVLGPTYVGGSVTIAGNQASFLCPILVTPGQITTSGSAAMGTVAAPMVLLQNGGATGAMSLGSNGTFTGLAINMDGAVNLPAGNGSTADIVGAVFSTGSITFGGNTQVCYNPTVLANLQTTAASTSTNVLPGTWQELSPSGSY